MDLKTADLCDRFGEAVAVCEPLFRDFGGTRCFAGPAATVKCFEDNSLVRTLLEEPGKGRVLVVDAGGSLRCAVLGDRLAAGALRNGWNGVVIYGCVRDAAALSGMPFGVKALAAHPRKTLKRGEGQRDVALSFAGVTFRPRHFVYCDEDGVIVSAHQLPLVA
jgi:regulator of ribonuclease activity A